MCVLISGERDVCGCGTHTHTVGGGEEGMCVCVYNNNNRHTRETTLISDDGSVAIDFVFLESRPQHNGWSTLTFRLSELVVHHCRPSALPFPSRVVAIDENQSQEQNDKEQEKGQHFFVIEFLFHVNWKWIIELYPIDGWLYLYFYFFLSFDWRWKKIRERTTRKSSCKILSERKENRRSLLHSHKTPTKKKELVRLL